MRRLWAQIIALLLAGSADAACPVAPGPRHTVASVLEGGSLRLDDGSELVLSGIVLPEEREATQATAPGWNPLATSRAALQALTIGRTIEPGIIGRSRDRYGRARAQAVIIDPATGAEQWLQAALVTDGHARVLPEIGLTPCIAALLALEQQARTARRGLWQQAAFAPKPADRPRDLLRLQQTFVLVEGRVLNVADRRRTIYLNFGTSWREDFTVEIDGRARGLFAASGLDLANLAGRHIRVRGWISYRGGPMIPVSLPEQIELLGPSD